MRPAAVEPASRREGSEGSALRSLGALRGPGPVAFKSSPFVTVPPGAMLEVHLDSWLRRFGPPSSERVEAATVAQLLDALEGRYPRLRYRIRDETGRLRPYVRVFVDGEDVSGTTGVDASLVGARSIDILHSIAGG